MHNMTRVGVDWAKMVIQVQAFDVAGKVVINRCIQRASFLAWCSGLPAGCLVAMEACTGAHHWCRPLIKLGRDARMMSAQLVAPHRIQGKTGKNDANDAAAACEAASRAHMHFVPPKTLDQQGMLCVHRLRQALKQERIAAHRKDSEQVQRAAEPRGIGVITASALWPRSATSHNSKTVPSSVPGWGSRPDTIPALAKQVWGHHQAWRQRLAYLAHAGCQGCRVDCQAQR